MNKLTVSLYILITCAIVVLLNSYIAMSTMYANKMNKIDNNYEQLKLYESANTDGKGIILVIGNSYVASSFYPPNENNEIVMFTVAGMPMVDMLGIIENLPEKNKVTSIVIGIGYNYATPLGGSSAGYHKYFKKNILGKLWSSIPLVRGRSIASTVLKQDIVCLLSFMKFFKCQKKSQDENETGSTTPAVARDHLKVIRNDAQRRLKEYQPFTSNIHDNFPVFLERISAACQKRGIKLYAYTAPIFSELRDKLQPEFLNDFYDKIQRSGIPYVDLNLVFPDLDASKFKNATHISKSILREKTTEYLIKKFNIGQYKL